MSRISAHISFIFVGFFIVFTTTILPVFEFVAYKNARYKRVNSLDKERNKEYYNNFI
jgi:uncharacterized membrane protein